MPWIIVRKHLQPHALMLYYCNCGNLRHSASEFTAGAAVACTGAVIFFVVVPALLLLSPLLLLLSVLSLFYHKATRLRHQQSRSVTIYNQNSSVIAEVGVWSVISDRYKTDLLEPSG